MVKIKGSRFKKGEFVWDELDCSDEELYNSNFQHRLQIMKLCRSLIIKISFRNREEGISQMSSIFEKDLSTEEIFSFKFRPLEE